MWNEYQLQIYAIYALGDGEHNRETHLINFIQLQ